MSKLNEIITPGFSIIKIQIEGETTVDVFTLTELKCSIILSTTPTAHVVEVDPSGIPTGQNSDSGKWKETSNTFYILFKENGIEIWNKISNGVVLLTDMEASYCQDFTSISVDKLFVNTFEICSTSEHLFSQYGVENLEQLMNALKTRKLLFTNTGVTKAIFSATPPDGLNGAVIVAIVFGALIIATLIVGLTLGYCLPDSMYNPDNYNK